MSSSDNDAQLNGVHNVLTFTVKLWKSERKLAIPDALGMRVVAQEYTWKLYTSDNVPANTCGLMGDVCITTRDDIYMKCEDNTWSPWRRWLMKDLNKKKKKKNKGSKQMEYIRQSHHPWLQSRILQFNGTTLEWNNIDMYRQTSRAWNLNFRRNAVDAVTYKYLRVGWIARYVLAQPRQAPSRRISTAIEYIDKSVPSSTEAGSRSLLRKREREDTLPSQPEQRSPKRARRGDDDIDPQQDQGEQTTEQYLTGLPMSLAHHTQLLATLGITDPSYFRSLSRLPRPAVDEAIAALQQHCGITFLESLVLRTALHALRRTSPPPSDPHVEPHANIATFLANLHPRMGRHAPVFTELGIAVGNIPILVQLDANSYAEFERALGVKGLTWVEVFLLKAGIREHEESLAT